MMISTTRFGSFGLIRRRRRVGGHHRERAGCRRAPGEIRAEGCACCARAFMRLLGCSLHGHVVSGSVAHCPSDAHRLQAAPGRMKESCVMADRTSAGSHPPAEDRPGSDGGVDDEAVVRSTFSALDDWRKVRGPFIPVPGSDLAIDDEDWPPFGVSQVAWAGFTVAAEHLQAIRAHIDVRPPEPAQSVRVRSPNAGAHGVGGRHERGMGPITGGAGGANRSGTEHRDVHARRASQVPACAPRTGRAPRY